MACRPHLSDRDIESLAREAGLGTGYGSGTPRSPHRVDAHADLEVVVIPTAVSRVPLFLGRARYERVPEAVGSRNGSRPRRVQTAEGEISIAMPQVRGSLTRAAPSQIRRRQALGHGCQRRRGPDRPRVRG